MEGETKGQPKQIITPEWFEHYKEKLIKNHKDPLEEVKALSSMTTEELEKHIGGKIGELPYEVLETLFIDGSDDQNVVGVLRTKRADYLKKHPEKQVSKGASEGIITFDGRFISKKVWETASASEKRGALVGSTCFHYNSDTPNMGSNPKDRF